MAAADTQEQSTITLPFLRNTWYVAGWASEFQGVGPFARVITNEPIVLYRSTDARLVALADRCAHRWAPLSFGRVEGDELRCMYHGAKFASDGRCVEVPGQDRIAKVFCVRSYPVVEKHRLVWVWMGDSDAVDHGLIPNLGMLDQPWRRVYHGSLDYEVNYALINDNLLDLSHIAFLHEKTVGQPVNSALCESIESPYTPGGSEAQPIERGVRVEGWVSGARARSVLLPKNVPNGDLWSRTDFLAPGIFASCDQMHPGGTAERSRDLAPDAASVALSDSMSIQAVTPIAARHTRYFYSFGPRSADLTAEESDSMWKIVEDTFAEDLKMIEAQQKIIDRYPGKRMGGIAADRGLGLFRALMKKLLEAERATPDGGSGTP